MIKLKRQLIYTTKLTLFQKQISIVIINKNVEHKLYNIEEDYK